MTWRGNPDSVAVMRILLVGAGGVGNAIAKIAARRDFFDLMVVSDYDLARAEATVTWIEERRSATSGVSLSQKWPPSSFSKRALR